LTLLLDRLEIHNRFDFVSRCAGYSPCRSSAQTADRESFLLLILVLILDLWVVGLVADVDPGGGLVLGELGGEGFRCAKRCRLRSRRVHCVGVAGRT